MTLTFEGELDTQNSDKFITRDEDMVWINIWTLFRWKIKLMKMKLKKIEGKKAGENKDFQRWAGRRQNMLMYSAC